jgi:hypothetical protein
MDKMFKGRVIVRRPWGTKDKNHAAIVEALEQAKIAVIDMSHMGKGFPDLVVARRGVNLLVEIKNPETLYGRRGLNKLQRSWASSWPAPVYILRTLDDVARFANLDDAGLIHEREAIEAVLGKELLK